MTSNVYKVNIKEMMIFECIISYDLHERGSKHPLNHFIANFFCIRLTQIFISKQTYYIQLSLEMHKASGYMFWLFGNDIMYIMNTYHYPGKFNIKTPNRMG